MAIARFVQSRYDGVPPKVGSWLRATVAVLVSWWFFLLFEGVFVAVAHRRAMAGAWELRVLVVSAIPIALAFLLPMAPIAVAIGHLVRASFDSHRARVVLGAFAFVSSAALSFGVTTGRHFEEWPRRLAFVGLFALCATVLSVVAIPKMGAFVTRRRLEFPVAALFAALFGAADAVVLPRLYPAMHAVLGALALLSAAIAAVAIVRSKIGVGVVLVCGTLLAVVLGARNSLQNADNLRFVLSEQAPMLGRAVRCLNAVAPPGKRFDAALSNEDRRDFPRSLDWSGRDIVLVTIDALRADHVSAYGYARLTTPNIDRIADRGTLFEAAYCQTPHTSYSITSLMTGKYMRPLLRLGIGHDSDTWASMLRRYGYRTAAFYPPAIFFVDENRFNTFRDRVLDFEYVKVEFADTKLRLEQIDAYLSRAARDLPLFMWVHLFEPHEPYVMHPEHRFGDARASDIDRYDSEIAAADDAVGQIVRRFEARRPGAIVMVTADHGEEFGEHGGRYHGSTVYEEQVHVPLVVAGEGIAHRRVASVVQTIDLLPTTLSALAIPRPARIRGRDLGPLMAVETTAPDAPLWMDDAGIAFAETEDYTLLARAKARLVCVRRADACALYEPESDPFEVRDLSEKKPDVAASLRHEAVRIAREHGRYESSAGADLPSPLRRALMGDADAADEAAELLDDANVTVRRTVAMALFRLRVESTAPRIRQALLRHDIPRTDRSRGFSSAESLPEHRAQQPFSALSTERRAKRRITENSEPSRSRYNERNGDDDGRGYLVAALVRMGVSDAPNAGD